MAELMKGWLVTIALLIAVAMVVALTLHARALKLEIAAAEERAISLRPGSLAPMFRAPSLDGDSVLLGSTDASAQIYFVYNTECPYCKRSISAWNELHRRLKDSKAEVIGISLDSFPKTSQYHNENLLEYKSVIATNPRINDIHKFGIVPQTIVLDSEGQVRYSRIGVLETRSSTDSVLMATYALFREKSATTASNDS